MSRTPHGHRDGRLHRRFSPSILRLESRELLTATIADPSFESVVVGSGNFGYAYNPAGSPWTFAANSGNNGSGISGNGSAFTSGNPAAPDGSQVAFIQAFGTISQSIAGWDAGTYRISLQAAQRGGYNLYENFQVLLDGAVITSFNPSDATYRTYTTPIFQVTAGTHTLTFQGTNSAQSDNTALIDAVSLAPVTTTAPVVNDPGFESFAVGNGGYIYNPGGSAWTFSMESGVSGTGVSGNGSPFTNKSPNAPEGVQVAFIQQVGTITQSIAGWNPGSYQLSFQSVQRTNYQTSSEDFQVYLDNTVVGTFTPSGTSYQTYTTDPFPVTAGSHTLSFRGLDSAGGDNTAFIDDLRVIDSSGGKDIAPTPVITSPASASPLDVIGTTTQLSVGATVDGDLSNLIYSWSVKSKPDGAFNPQFSDNGSNAASNVTATLTSAGNYTLLVTVGYHGSIASSEVTVTLEQTVTSILVSPATPFVKPGANKQLSAVAEDQFGHNLDKPPTFAWSVASGVGSVDPTGLYSVPRTGSGEVAIQVSAGNVSATAPLEVFQQSNLINFDDLRAGTIVTDQYQNATFSGDPAFPNQIVPSTDASYPNSIGAPSPRGNPYNHPLYIDFTLPVNDLYFEQMRDDAIAGVTIGQVRVFESRSQMTTVPIVSGTNTVDLSKYHHITRIEIVDITDPYGLIYDDFRFTPDSLNLTAHRTGDYQGQVVSNDTKTSGDPSKYVMLTDNNYTQADGTPALSSTTAEIPGVGVQKLTTGSQQSNFAQSSAVSMSSGDNDLAQITLGQLPQGVGQGKLKIVLSDPTAVRLFKPDGSLLYEGGKTSDGVLTLDLSNPSGYLAGLQSGSVDLWLEGVHKVPNFDFAILYEDAKGRIVGSDDIHMVIADWTFRSHDGQAIGDVMPIWSEDLINDATLGVSSPATQSSDNTLYKNLIEGLPDSLTKQLNVQAVGNSSGGYIDNLVANPGQSVSKIFQSLYAPSDDYGNVLQYPITSDQLTAVQALLNINLLAGPTAESTLLLGPGDNPTDKFTRGLSTATKPPITLSGQGGVYNDGDTVKVTVTLGPPMSFVGLSRSVSATLSNGKSYSGVASSTNPNQFIIAVPVFCLNLNDGGQNVKTPYYPTLNITGKETYLRFSALNGPPQTTEITLANESVTLAVLPQGKTMNRWQQQTWDSLKQGNSFITGNVNQRNLQITTLYASMFNSNPQAFEWAGMAAFASANVGKALSLAGRYAMVPPLPDAISIPDSQKLIDGFGEGNMSIFMDMYPQMLAYQAGLDLTPGQVVPGSLQFINMFLPDEMTADQKTAWGDINAGLINQNDQQRYDGNTAIGMVEQTRTLQAVLNQELLLWAKATSVGSFWLSRVTGQAIQSPIPTDGSYFQVRYPGVSFGDGTTRFGWFRDTMVPAWRGWRTTHINIKLNLLLDGSYLKGQ